jgi:hypothetical protein
MATPKVSRQLFDNNLTRAAAGGSGPRNRRVVILGNATDGPLNAPVKVSSPSDAAELFGPFGSGAYNLTRGLKECFDGQSAGTAAPDVYGLRVVGYTDATTPQSLAAHRTWASDSTGSDVFKLEAVHPGTLYNDISIWANATELYIYNPKTKLNTKITWTGLDISDLASLINADISLNEIMFASSIVGDQLINQDIFTGNGETKESLANGTDWDPSTDVDADNHLYAGLAKAYDSFIVDFFDIMAIVDVTLDAVPNDEPDGSGDVASFAQQMSTFLDDFNGEMIGVTSFEPIVGSGVGGRVLRDDVVSRLNSLVTNTVLAGFDQPFMFCVDGEGIFNGQSSKYAGNLNCAVAGLIAAMPTEEAIYRHILPGVTGLVWAYAGKDASSGSLQVDLLSDVRVSVPSIKNGEIKLSESRSLAKAGSDYENLMTVLILQEALEICRNVAKDFLGKVSSAELLQAFQTSLDSQLGTSLVPRVLRGFLAPVVMTPGERVVGRVTIPLTLQPQFELRDVHYNVELSAEDLA